MLSSQYIFEVLKADLAFVKNPKILSKEVKQLRAKQLPAIRHAANSMFIVHPKTKDTKLFEPFEEELEKYEPINCPIFGYFSFYYFNVCYSRFDEYLQSTMIIYDTTAKETRLFKPLENEPTGFETDEFLFKI